MLFEITHDVLLSLKQLLWQRRVQSHGHHLPQQTFAYVLSLTEEPSQGFRVELLGNFPAKQISQKALL